MFEISARVQNATYGKRRLLTRVGFYRTFWSYSRAKIYSSRWSKRSAPRQNRQSARCKHFFSTPRIGWLLEMLLPIFFH